MHISFDITLISLLLFLAMILKSVVYKGNPHLHFLTSHLLFNPFHPDFQSTETALDKAVKFLGNDLSFSSHPLYLLSST
jgi:hypothetical protein